MNDATAIHDLHALTREHGTAAVAAVIGCSARALEDLRRGHTALTVDDLAELEAAYPTFDMAGTVRRLADERRRKGKARKMRGFAFENV